METPKLNWSDATGGKWHFFISLAAARELKNTQSLDLLDPRCVERLFGADPLARIEAMAELARTQWTEAGLTYANFAELIIGGPTSYDDASAALKAGLADFFRRIGRGDLATVADRAWEAITAEMQLRTQKAAGPKVGEIFAAALKQTDEGIDAELDRALATMAPTTGAPFGSSPPSPGSIGDR
jgi:hypothetical protein